MTYSGKNGKRLGMAGLVIATLLYPQGCDNSRPVKPQLDAAGRMLLDSVRDDGIQPTALLAYLRLPADATVADVGAGPGYLTLPLARALPAGHIIATDLRHDYLDVVAARVRSAGLHNVHTRLASIDDSGLQPSSVDLVILCQVDHYLQDRAVYLSRLRTVLRPRGRIALINYIRYQKEDHAAAVVAGLRILNEWLPSAAFFLLILDDPDAESM